MADLRTSQKREKLFRTISQNEKPFAPPVDRAAAFGAISEGAGGLRGLQHPGVDCD